MTELEQQMALCQWMGWKRSTYGEHEPFPLWISPSGNVMDKYGDGNGLPGTNSLDVLREMEGRLVGLGHWPEYLKHLNQIICDDLDEPLNQDTETIWCMVHASAGERREALLKTLGLWKD